MALAIYDPTNSNILQIANDRSARVVLYDGNGNPAVVDNGNAIPLNQPGLPASGRDYKLNRLLRASPDGYSKAGIPTPVFYDSTEGAAVDTNRWIQTTTTMTITQSANAGILFNAGSSAAATVGAMQQTQNHYPVVGRSALAARYRLKPSLHFSNNLIELGFGTPASATAASIGDGAVWRKDGTGQWVPVISINGSEVLGTPISNATFVASIVGGTDYALFEVFLEETRASFRITTTGGVIVGSEQSIDFGTMSGTFGTTQLPGMVRTYNSAATGTAVQITLSQSSVWLTDIAAPPWQQIQVGMQHGSITSPTAYTQLANYANSAAPASAALSNTAAGYATLGGQWQFAAVAGAETDYALFAIAIPSPFTFFCTGVRIAAFNLGAAVATTPTLLQWGLAFGSSAVSLATGAPYSPFRKAIGAHSFPVGAAIGANATPDVQWQGLEPVFPGRFLHIILKMPIGTATASQIIRGTCDVDGYFQG